MSPSGAPDQPGVYIARALLAASPAGDGATEPASEYVFQPLLEEPVPS